MKSILEVKYRVQNDNENWLVQEGQRHIEKDGTIVYWWKTIFCSRDFMESFNAMRIMCAVNLA